MYRFLLKPKWIALTLASLVGVVVMVNLGLWQLRRYHEREDFKAEVRARTAAEVVPYEDLAGKPPADIEWRTVTATGTYVPGKDFVVVNVSQSGGGGSDPVGGLLLADGTVLVVNRGFLPGAEALPAAPEGEVTITGRVRASQKPGLGQTSDDGSKTLTQIRRVELDVLATQFDQRIQPVYLDQVDMRYEPATMQPVAMPDLDGGPPHLSYTIQWFIFSTAVLVGWVLAVRNHVNDLKGKPKKRRLPPIADEYAS